MHFLGSLTGADDDWANQIVEGSIVWVLRSGAWFETDLKRFTEK